MDYIKIILLLVAFNCPVLSNAMNNCDEDDDLYKENYELKKELAKKEVRIKELETALADIEAEKNKVDSLLKVEKASGKSKELKSQLQTLEQENKRLSAELEQCASKIEDAVSQQSKNYQEQISQLLQQHSEDSTEIVSLREDLKDLANFRKMWIAQLAESVNEKWLNKPYSQINIQELEKALKQYEEFASTDVRIADAFKKLELLMADCQIYNQGISTISTPYDKNKINTVMNSMKSLLDRTTNPTSKDELSLLHWKLDNYGITIEIFQDVIKAVDKQLSGQSDHKQAWPLVNAVLNKLEKDDEYITAVKKIPWLSEQYDAYYKNLKKNCIAVNEVRNEIMNIHP